MNNLVSILLVLTYLVKFGVYTLRPIIRSIDAVFTEKLGFPQGLMLGPLKNSGARAL